MTRARAQLGLVTLAAALSLAASCRFRDEPLDGKQACAPTPLMACPDGYQCAVDDRCYRRGHVPTADGGDPDIIETEIPDARAEQTSAHPDAPVVPDAPVAPDAPVVPDAVAPDAPSKSLNGATCAAGASCQSGECVDGVCCDSACTGQCQSCNEPNMVGRCVPVMGAPRATRGACNGGGACQGQCDGLDPVRCLYPGLSVPCAAATCAGGMATTATACDGTGACTAPMTAACASRLCADATRCAGGCDDAHPCAAGTYCDTTGVCLSKKANGAKCLTGSECATAYCVDGVCCDSACDGQCQACGEAASPGRCVIVSGVPRGNRSPCAGSSDACRGTCGGTQSGACSYPGASTVCAAATCAGAKLTASAVCNGAGGCATPATTTCHSNQCADGTSCLDMCSASKPCGAGTYCDASGVCQGKKANGAICAASAECANGNCVDGVCCDGACAGQCESCSEPSSVGKCASVTGNPRGARAACAGAAPCKGTCDGTNGTRCAFPGASTQCAPGACANGSATTATACNGAGACSLPTTMPCASNLCADTVRCSGGCSATAPCPSGQFCNASAICAAQKANGAACQTAAECGSGNCVDGVCCNLACNGQCEACNEPGMVGLCVAVGGTPRGTRPTCAGTTCRGTCNVALRTACTYPGASVVCSGATCASGTGTTASVCNGAGSCTASSATACRAHQCLNATTCLDTCSAAQPCAAGSFCDATGVCQVKKVNGAACTTTSECATGNCVDGVCCDSACSGQCESCAEPGSVGKCTPATGAPRGARTACAGTTPCKGTCGGADGSKCTFPGTSTQCAPGSCANGSATTATACNGAGACTLPVTMPCASNLCANMVQCSSGCSAAIPCPSGQFCNASAICVPRKASGATCQTGAECSSGNCADGVCCNLACGGQCEACDEPGTVGQCVAVSGTPRGARPACLGTTCRGACNVALRTACTYPGASVGCTDAVCLGATGTSATVCNGAGACTQATTAPCRAHQCLNPTTCLDTCTATQPCATGSFCDGSGVCQPVKANGAACQQGAECTSNNCVDGTCCTTSSCPTCQACTGAGGTCAKVISAPDPDSCLSCSAAGQCLVVDQQQLMRAAFGGPLGGTNSDQKLAQVVTAGIAGSLVEVRLAVTCTPGSAMTVQIQGVTTAGAPAGNVLSTVTFQPGALPTDGSLRSIPLTTPVTLAVGTQFAIVATGPATDSCAMTFGPPGDTYPGGKSFFDARPNAPGWVENTSDLPFQTFMVP